MGFAETIDFVLDVRVIRGGYELKPPRNVAGLFHHFYRA